METMFLCDGREMWFMGVIPTCLKSPIILVHPCQDEFEISFPYNRIVHETDSALAEKGQYNLPFFYTNEQNPKAIFTMKNSAIND